MYPLNYLEASYIPDEWSCYWKNIIMVQKLLKKREKLYNAEPTTEYIPNTRWNHSKIHQEKSRKTKEKLV